MTRKDTKRARRSSRKGTRRQQGGVFGCIGRMCGRRSGHTTVNNNSPPVRGRTATHSQRKRSGSPHTNEEAKEYKKAEFEARILANKERRDAYAATLAANEKKKEAASNNFAEWLQSEKNKEQGRQAIAELGAKHLRGVHNLPPTSNKETWKQLARLPNKGKELLGSTA